MKEFINSMESLAKLRNLFWKQTKANSFTRKTIWDAGANVLFQPFCRLAFAHSFGFYSSAKLYKLNECIGVGQTCPALHFTWCFYHNNTRCYANYRPFCVRLAFDSPSFSIVSIEFCRVKFSMHNIWLLSEWWMWIKSHSRSKQNANKEWKINFVH